MANWKNPFRHVEANADLRDSNFHKGEQIASNATTRPSAIESDGLDEKIDFALKFVDTLSALEAALHTSDDPEEIAHGAMRVACDFYEADWCGFLTVDLELGLWTPFWWYNTNPTDRTSEFTNEFESAAKLDRWVSAMKDNNKVYVCDAKNIRRDFPEE